MSTLVNKKNKALEAQEFEAAFRQFQKEDHFCNSFIHQAKLKIERKYKNYADFKFESPKESSLLFHIDEIIEVQRQQMYFMMMMQNGYLAVLYKHCYLSAESSDQLSKKIKIVYDMINFIIDEFHVRIEKFTALYKSPGGDNAVKNILDKFFTLIENFYTQDNEINCKINSEIIGVAIIMRDIYDNHLKGIF